VGVELGWRLPHHSVIVDNWHQELRRKELKKRARGTTGGGVAKTGYITDIH
jgi:hypothetical protein